jgi:hypothetical protein
MDRGRATLLIMASSLVAVVALSLALARPAAANHDQEDDQLWVTVAINAAGGDRISVTDGTESADGPFIGLAGDAAVALGHPKGSFKAHEDFDGAYVALREKLTRPNERGGLSWGVDSGNLQLLAQQRGYEVLILEVCTPRVRQVVDALITPESPGFSSPGTRCRGWYQLVDDSPIRAVFELSPDRDRYPRAVGRAVGTAAIVFGVFGIGATLLRRGPLRRRRPASWVLAVVPALLVATVGWVAVTVTIWWNGSAADPVLLSRGSVGEQVARTMLPGLVFLLPALLPAALLLSVPAREKPAPAPPPVWPGAAPQPAPWWPRAWWPQWAAQHPQGQPPPPGWGGPGSRPDGPPEAPPPGQSPAPPLPGPAAGGSSGWATPGSGGG